MNTDVIFTALAWLGTYLVHSTLLLGTAALIARKGMLGQPRLVERMWKVAALGGILTATAQVSLVSTPVPGSFSLRSIVAAGIEPESARAANERSEPERRAPRLVASTGLQAGRQPTPPRPGLRPTVARTSATSRDTGIAPAPPAARPIEPPAERPREAVPMPVTAATTTPTASQPLPWKPAAVATWAVVGGWGLLGFLFAWSRLFARLSDRRVLKSGLLVDQLAELGRRAGVKRRIRLTASTSIDSPITHGWFRREICVPERALIELSPKQLESTLAHELAHVLRRDPLWFGIFALLERVLFFQPLNRLARRQLQEIAEFVCDDQAVRWTGGRLALASALTEIAHWIVGRRQLALPSPGMASSRLGDRVERLLDDRVSRTLEPARAWLPPTALGALGLMVFAVPGVTAAAPASAETAGDGTPEHLRFEFDPPGASPFMESTTGELAPPRESAFGIRTDQELLDTELQLLQSELDELRLELDETELYDRFEHALENIERRMEDLRSRKQRLNALISRALSEGDTHLDENP